MNAHECFMIANDRFARGHYLDAQTLYDRACRLEPDNTAYSKAQKRLQTLAFAFFKKGARPVSNTDDAGQCCCDCGEGCCEGLGEGCCGEICSNCDCDGCDGCCDSCDCDCG